MPARILLVEDDDQYLHLLQAILEKAGHATQLAASAAGALRQLSSGAALPDLMIIDVGLPDKAMDGLDLCRTLKNNPATQYVPVIILSCHTENVMRLKAAVCRADMVFSKPILSDELLLAVQTAIGAAHAPREVLYRTGVELDPRREMAILRGRTLKNLDPRLFDLLYLLVKHAPDYVTGGRIMSSMRLFTRDSEVEALVARLRSRLRREFGCNLIVFSPDKGFRLELSPIQSDYGQA
ncbi:MAG: response regulator transcription factor [Elusimicrobia bacterium]|nr:response regulator transcription factor [Elusimicrobiota bacterium]